jgi:predicted acylesterase/phospholipase RssA
MYASGMDVAEIDARCYEEWVRRRPLSDYRIPRTSIIRGQKIREMLLRTFSGPIEMAPRPFFCVSVDLLSAELVVHRRRSLGLAVGASMNLPGIGPPLAAGGRLLVDGGLRNNLPVDVMAGDGEGPIIAVDVGGAAAMELLSVEDAPRARVLGRNDHWHSEEDHDVILPSLPELMTRIVTLSSVDGAALAEEHAQLVIRPRNDDVGLFEFHMLDDLRVSGRRAAREAMRGRATASDELPAAPVVTA